MKKAVWFSLVIRVGLGAQFFWAGFTKAQAFDWWRELVQQMQILPDSWVGPLAGALPGVEMLVGLLLVLGWLQRAAALLSILIFACFTILMWTLIERNAPQMCGCFGPGSEYPVDWIHLAFDVLGVLASLVVICCPLHTWSIDRPA